MAFDGKYGVITAEKKEFHEGEPLFIIRAQDATAVPTLEAYYTICKSAECSDSHLMAIDLHQQAIKDWQTVNPDLVKLPD